MTTPDRERALGSAMAELRSAYALIADPNCDPVTAMPHLQRAWRSVAWLSRGEVPDSPGETLDTWLAPEHLALVASHSRTRVHATLSAVFRHARDPQPWTDDELPPELPASRELLRHLRVLGSLVDALDEQQHGRTPKLQLALRWGGRAAVWIGSASVFLLIALRPWQNQTDGKWRTALYPNKRLEGNPTLRRDVDVDFEWGRKPPMDSAPSDSFSARWDTCLVLDEDVDAAFQVTADDGARVIVDGKQIIDDWRPRKKPKGERLKLEAGVHHVRVEYFENYKTASIHLLASFERSEPPSPIPEHMLRFPGMEFDEHDPCKGVDE